MTVVRAGRYGTVPALELTNERLILVVAPGFGGRVLSLVDRSTGRDWLEPGLPHAAAYGGEASYGAEVASGWDECLPTVAPCRDPTSRSVTLRDHGDVWGRPCEASVGNGTVTLIFDGRRAGATTWPYRFVRRVALTGSAATVHYEIRNDSPAPLPFLWSMHPLLALEPGGRLSIPDVPLVEATFADGPGMTGMVPAGQRVRVPWPEARLPDGSGYRLDVVPGLQAREALKLYAGPLVRGRAAASGADGSWIGLGWEVRDAPYLGIWLSHGGWPNPEAGVRQVSLEPTCAPADDLASAMAFGRAWTVPSGVSRAWSVRLQVGRDVSELRRFLASDAPGYRHVSEVACRISLGPARSRPETAGKVKTA